MSYQVLARKYRPATFEELEGQEHVLKALVNALQNNRLHHAYLFTGTRGVGKTTIARILAKCLSCEQGVSAIPCGECSSCREIAEGRSVDLIEVDAASRTKVEDTRELLDNVQYLPTRSRFKVYLIDEVHMLSNHSFNALLKTLEEPPEHVKFLLATTDPKKLPVTVLSRCLQFNLKNLSPERIVNYLKKILPVEGVPFDESALWQLGRAADGSMRDALSLTDQAISFGDGAVREASVKDMLGSIDQREVFDLLNGLVQKNADSLMDKVRDLAEFAPDYQELLGDLLSILHRVAVAQAAPAAIDNSQGDQALIMALSTDLSKEDVQLYYQIGLMGRRDLPFSPDLRSGFEMVLLRMLAFEPFEAAASAEPARGSTEKKTVEFGRSGKLDALLRQSAKPLKQGVPERLTEPAQVLETLSVPESAPETESEPMPEPVSEPLLEPVLEPVLESEFEAEPGQNSRLPEPPEQPVENQQDSQVPKVEDPSGTARVDSDNWPDVLGKLGVAGMTNMLASNCVVGNVTANRLDLILDESQASLWGEIHEARLMMAFKDKIGWEVRVQIRPGVTDRPTPAELERAQQAREHAEAVELIHSDLKVQQLIESFDGQLNQESITARK